MSKKQRLFEVMKKVNSGFKPNLNENIENKNFRLTETASKSKTFVLNLWGEDEELYFDFNQYADNGALAVQLMSPMEGPYATVSVNLPESAELPQDEFFMKGWSENQDIAEQLIQKKIVEPTGKQASSGFITAQSYKMNPIYSDTGIGDVSLNEVGGDGFSRMKVYLIDSKEGDYLGELDPIDDETAMYFDTIDDVVATPEFEKFAQEKNITREQVGRVRTESVFTMNGKPLDKEYYSPSQSQELFDPETNTWYNLSGQEMRNPDEYERYSDGTNQWGERYDDDY